MKASIVIPAYNRLDFTRLCLKSIKLYTPEDHEIIVIDNGSADGTADFLKTLSGVRVISNLENRGFPAACNQGIGVSAGDMVVLLNNDIVVTPGWLSNLRRVFEVRPKAGLAGPMCNHISGLQSLDTDYRSLRGMIRFARKFNRQDISCWRPAVRIGFGCAAIRRTALERVGLVDELFTPGNFEDDDYSLRTALAGFEVLIAGDTFVHHFGGNVFTADDRQTRLVMSGNKAKFEAKWGLRDGMAAYPSLDLLDVIPMGKGPVLECLCGAGANGLELKLRDGREVVGIETNPALARIASRHLDLVLTGDPEQVTLPFPPGHFDRVILSRALEWSRQPSALIDRAAVWLREGGELLVLSRNAGFAPSCLKLIGGAWPIDYALPPERRPANCFTPLTLLQLLDRPGWELAGVVVIMAPQTPSLMADIEMFKRVWKVLGIDPGILERCTAAPEMIVRLRKGSPERAIL